MRGIFECAVVYKEKEEEICCILYSPEKNFDIGEVKKDVLYLLSCFNIKISKKRDAVSNQPLRGPTFFLPLPLPALVTSLTNIYIFYIYKIFG